MTMKKPKKVIYPETEEWCGDENMVYVKFEFNYDAVANTKKAIKEVINTIREDLRSGNYNTDEQILVHTHLFEDDIPVNEYLKRLK